MKENTYHDQLPETLEELTQMVKDEGLDISTSVVVISYTTPNPQDPSFYDGWSAQIDGMDAFGNDVSISTCGWPDKDTLVADIKSLDFPDVQVEKLIYKAPK